MKTMRFSVYLTLLLLCLSFPGSSLAQVYNLHLGARAYQSPALMVGLETSLSRHGSLLAEVSLTKADNGTNNGKGIGLSILYRHGIYQAFTGPYLEVGAMGLLAKNDESEYHYRRKGVALLLGVGYSKLLSRHWSLDLGVRPGLLWQSQKCDYNPLDLFLDRTITHSRSLRLEALDVHVSLNYLF